MIVTNVLLEPQAFGGRYDHELMSRKREKENRFSLAKRVIRRSLSIARAV